MRGTTHLTTLGALWGAVKKKSKRDSMETRQHEMRREERVSAELAVDLGTTTGITRDVSASGMYFETDATYVVGNEIRFAVDLDTPGGKMIMKCRGEIVRVRLQDGKVGVGVKIVESAMAPAE
jgi:PilZ domain-containing protein